MPITSQRFAHAYQKTQIETSRPAQLVVMLYDGAIRFLMRAVEGFQSGDLEDRHNNLLRAQRILGELLSTLDHEQGGEIASNLHKLYAFMMNQLVEANLFDRKQPVEDVIRLLKELRDGWVAADRETAGMRDER